MGNTDFRSKPKYLAPLEFHEKAENDFDVLTTKENIQRLAINICTGIRHPVTIIDANRIEDVKNAYDAKKIRINSEAEYFSLRNACRLFRRCAGDEKCYECDHYHADKFSCNLNESEVDYSDHPEFFNNEYENNQPEIISVEGFERPVYEYRCPIFGYRELLIPLFFNEKEESIDEEDTILGIVFIGQSVVESKGDIDFVKNSKESFFKKNPPEKLFEQSGKKPSEIERWIIDVDKQFYPLENLFRSTDNKNNNSKADNTMNFINDDDYKKFIKDSCRRIRAEEKNLTNIFVEKRKNYFYNKVEEIVEDYFDNIERAKAERKTSENQASYTELLIAWNELIVATDLLKETFKIKGIYVFGDGTSLTVADNEKKPLYSRNYNLENRNWYYDVSVLKELKNDTFYTSFKYEEVINGLKSDIEKENCFIISYSDIALLFCVENLKKHKEKYKDLAGAIGKNFARIHSHIALVTADFMQEKLVTTLRINRHETSHISTRLKDDIYFYFSENGKKFTKLDSEKQSNIVDDLSNTTRLLSNMATNVGIITGSINKDNIKHKTDYLNVYDLLNKWRVMFRDRLVQRNLNLEFVSSESPGFSPVYTVPELFELMIYNLVDNAVKYAYRGTNIYMHWNKIEKGKSVFSIMNYGSEIKTEDRIFDLYTRGGSAEKSKKIDGDGIGLYSVKRISELLGCSLVFNAETDNTLVSEYNLPLIEWCKVKKSIRTSFNYDINVLDAFYENFPNPLKREIINITHNQITDFDVSVPYLNSRINDKIFKTVFTVEVPHELNLEEK